MINFIVKLRIFLWSMLALAVFFVLFMAVVPGGKITYSHGFEGNNSFIGNLTPIDRVKPDGKTIIGDPVYFSLYTPRAFNDSKMTLKYKRRGDLSDAPIIEVGVLVDAQSWRYDLLPIENKIIDEISLSWNTIREGDVVLLQRENNATSFKKFDSVKEFIDDLPRLEEIALYNYDLKTDYVLDDYFKSEELKQNFYSIRSSYEFYTYIKDEDLDFKFTFLDLNKNKDMDAVDILVYYRDEIIDSKHMEDDGNFNDDGKVGNSRDLELKIPGLPEGVYKIEIRANDDIVTKDISTKQQKMAFVNNVWLADEGSKDITLYTNSNILNVKTTNPASLQKIYFKGETLDLNETYKQFSVKSASSSREMKLNKDGVILAGLGVFGFSDSDLIDPRFKKVDSNINVDEDGINYILADYNSPLLDGEWKVVEVEFDLSRAYREKNKYNFVISVPGLKPEEINNSLEIGRIKFDLTGTNLLEYIKRRK